MRRASLLVLFSFLFITGCLDTDSSTRMLKKELRKNANNAKLVFYEKEHGSLSFAMSISFDKNEPYHSFDGVVDYFTDRDINIYDIEFDGEIIFSSEKDEEESDYIFTMMFSVEHECVVYSYQGQRYSKELTESALDYLESMLNISF